MELTELINSRSLRRRKMNLSIDGDERSSNMKRVLPFIEAWIGVKEDRRDRKKGLGR